MLIKFYSPSTQGLNHVGLHREKQYDKAIEQAEKRYKNIPYMTSTLDIFDNLKTDDIADFIDEQYHVAIEEADILLKNSFLTKTTHRQTLDQYEYFFFWEGFAFRKSDVIDYVSSQNMANTAYMMHPNQYTQDTKPFDNEDEYTDVTQSFTTHKENNTTRQQSSTTQTSAKQSISTKNKKTTKHDKNTVEVDKEAIRNITGYTYRPFVQHSGKEEYIKWQHDLIDDTHDIIVVDGCRQMGKSFTISEKLIEESFIANNHSLVCAFEEDATRRIRDYMLSIMDKFPKNTFTRHTQEKYIQNNITLSKIHFRTLSDEGAKTRGLTLSRVIVDEAQLVSKDIFEGALLPTLSTTGGQLIMMGTATSNTKCYMYKTILEIRRGVLSPEEASYYRVSIDDNPFTDPVFKKRIEAKKDLPKVKQEYYNMWGDTGESMFSIQQETNMPNILLSEKSKNFLVMGIDPARLNDRSGNSLLYVHYNHEEKRHQITIILSGFVPDSHKKKWELQASWYRKLIAQWNNNQEQSRNWYNVIDVTGVGDGVVSVFQTEGIKIAGKIRYTSGMSESDDFINYNVSKSILINNFIDMCQEGIIKVYKATNSDLLEEMAHIQEGTSRAGSVTMSSDFFDDITNATMIAAYFIKKRKLLGKSESDSASPYKSSGSAHIDSIEKYRDGTQNSGPGIFW